MDQNRRKFRAFGLLLATGFASGLFVQFNAPGLYFAPAPRIEPATEAPTAMTVSLAQEEAPIAGDPAPTRQSEEDQAKAAPAEPSTQGAEIAGVEPAQENPTPDAEEATAPVLRRYDALAAVIGNTLEIVGPDGALRHIYFAPRGLVAEFDAKTIEVRQWSRDDDHLCRTFGADLRECFYLAVELDPALRRGAAAALDARIRDSAVGTAIGTVQGFGDGAVRLRRGDLRGLPDYVPLMDDKPGRDWTGAAGAEPFVGALLLRGAADEDRAATFFAPNGQLFEVKRLTRRSVSLSIWNWRREGDRVCRSVDAPPGETAEECAHVRVAGGRIEFAEAAPARRAYLRWPWPGEEDGDGASRAAMAAEINLAPAAGASQGAFKGSITDLR
ncbi:hypothetical protein M2322_004060 [Rhodoblastus acidophilus]|uniref:hypothetical protein n=1 Tax=Rhodoblastus acidophilus TaxID=1074 RepID=UPI0022242D00|nr:hypothetical protein [Rhodoblastus acidophilus]MCW2318491.1 hypothetical protein [Rhodoblastus acidophilus]